ncbi:hypothetical protein PQX77_015219 [Marasmius sp. AFHP31]|nr:hypothetical protein PQX77_015219 [Marasmius sp. AFHP31]
MPPYSLGFIFLLALKAGGKEPEVAWEIWLERETTKMHAKLVDTLAKEDTPDDVTIAQLDIETQIVGIIFAGSETSANVMTECLLELAKNPDIQCRLCEELSNFAITRERQPSYEDFTNSSTLAYLEAVTRKTLRPKATLNSIGREVMNDNVVPLGTPLKTGQSYVHTLLVKAGAVVNVSIRDGIDVNKAIWGPDAQVF